MAKLKQISQSQFAILGMARLYYVNYIYVEKEWWADENERVIGAVIFDRTDEDWSYIVLGRDKTGLFRGIDQGLELPSQASARANLKERLSHYADSGTAVFSQDDETMKRKEILQPIVPVDQLHPDFRHLIEDLQFSAARRAIEETVYAFIDVDGNYVRDFQTTGFPGRLWELFLFRFFYEQEFYLSREFKRPDFCALQGEFRIGIEAVTVNPTAGENPPSAANAKEVENLLENYMPIKFGSSLFSKLQKKYWNDDHMRDVPFGIAIHDFHSGDSMTWSAPALYQYLYGVRISRKRDVGGKFIEHHEPIKWHEWKGKRIPSGFFGQPEAENVSAVLSSSSSTLAKWNRMGRMAGFGDPDTVMIRRGFKENPRPDKFEPVGFAVEVKPGSYSETWSEDIRVFHNPNARIPLPVNLFRGCSNMFLQDGEFRSAEPPGQHVITSQTVVITPKPD
jgi:hypothetical protein